jgi:hypothetical protein
MSHMLFGNIPHPQQHLIKSGTYDPYENERVYYKTLPDGTIEHVDSSVPEEWPMMRRGYARLVYDTRFPPALQALIDAMPQQTAQEVAQEKRLAGSKKPRYDPESPVFLGKRAKRAKFTAQSPAKTVDYQFDEETRRMEKAYDPESPKFTDPLPPKEYDPESPPLPFTLP